MIETLCRTWQLKRDLYISRNTIQKRPANTKRDVQKRPTDNRDKVVEPASGSSNAALAPA